MQQKTTLTFLFLIFLFTSIYAQTYKGIWMVRGNLKTTTQEINGSPSTIVNINPEVAFNFSKNWMAGGDLKIDVANKLARVGHGLFIRNTFIRAEKNEIFVQLFFNHESTRSLLSGGGRNKFSLTNIGPGVGLLHFFNPAVALETKLNYKLYSKYDTRGYKSKRNGDFLLEARLQYFFNSKLVSDSLAMNYQAKAGDWVIGGSAYLGERSNPFNNFYIPNLIQPFAGRFINKRILLGSGLNYNNDNLFERFVIGLAPFGRYYLRPGKKHQFFGELKFTYNYILEKRGDGYEGHSLSYIITPGIGYSTWILPQVSFDLKANLDKTASYIEGVDIWFKKSRFNFCLGLTAFLRKK